MHLSDDQNDRYFDLMDSLLGYVNDTFRVVEDFSPDSDDAFADAKAALVAQTLWDHVDVIDAYASDNPMHLDGRDLDQVRAWKYALPDTYTLVRYQDGCAILMSEAGLFSMAGLTSDPEEAIGPAPASVDLVLVPFDGGIICDGFMNVYDLTSSDEKRALYDRYEETVSQGIAFTADEFCARAKHVLARRHAQELDDLLADVEREALHEDEKLPAGFHRGVLAGLDPKERDDAMRAHIRSSEPSESTQAIKLAADEPVPRTLAACLACYSKEMLVQLARTIGMTGYSRLVKSKLAKELSEQLVADEELFVMILESCASGYFSAVRTLAENGDAVVPLKEAPTAPALPALLPFTFAFERADEVHAVMPQEVRALLPNVDFDDIARLRARSEAVYNCANACAIYYGIVSLADAYRAYCARVEHPFDRDEFDDIVGEHAAYHDGLFEVMTREENDYLVHFTLSEDYVARQVMLVRTGRFDTPEPFVNAATNEVRANFAANGPGCSRMSGDLRSELENVEQVRAALLGEHEKLEARPLPENAATDDLYEKLLADKRVCALRAFLDERVPDGRDDYTFPALVTEQLVQSAIEIGELDDMLDICDEAGVTGSDNGSGQLYSLVSNVYNVMPSWENNGWSAVELLEKMTGRTVFFNDDGQIMRVGADDPCPCGSGLKYRECHGR